MDQFSYFIVTLKRITIDTCNLHDMFILSFSILVKF